MLPSGQVHVPPASLQVTPEVDTRFMVIGTFPPAEISKTMRTVWIEVPAGQKMRVGSNRASVMDRLQIAAGVGVAVGSAVGVGVAGGGVAVGVTAVVVGAVVVVEPSLQLTRRHEVTTRRVRFKLAPWFGTHSTHPVTLFVASPPIRGTERSRFWPKIMGVRGAETIETRSLALHAAVASRLLADPSLWEHARQRVQGWRATGSRHPHFLSAWDDLLEAPVDRVAAALVDPGDKGQRLRRSSPFAFVLTSAERWKVWRAARADEAAREDQHL